MDSLNIMIKDDKRCVLACVFVEQITQPQRQSSLSMQLLYSKTSKQHLTYCCDIFSTELQSKVNQSWTKPSNEKIYFLYHGFVCLELEKLPCDKKGAICSNTLQGCMDFCRDMTVIAKQRRKQRNITIHKAIHHSENKNVI